MAEMRLVKSKDGVDIAFWSSGNGPHLVLVHGTTADHTRWSPVLPAFEEHFTVCAVDRRGRGGSGDAPEYSLEAEFDDIAAVCDALDGPVSLVGHSYGALCSLEAARRSRNIRRLVLYEPPVFTGQPLYPQDMQQRLEKLVAQGDMNGVLTTFLREVVRMPAHELDMFQSDPIWESRLKAAHTIPREFADEDYRLDPSRFREMQTPTLLLKGSDSPPFLQAATEAVHAALPNSQLVVLEGQQHAAISTAPRLFAREVLKFLLP